MRRRILPFAFLALAILALWTVGSRAADKNQDWAAYSGDKGATKYS